MVDLLETMKASELVRKERSHLPEGATLILFSQDEAHTFRMIVTFLLTSSKNIRVAERIIRIASICPLTQRGASTTLATKDVVTLVIISVAPAPAPACNHDRRGRRWIQDSRGWRCTSCLIKLVCASTSARGRDSNRIRRSGRALCPALR